MLSVAVHQLTPVLVRGVVMPGGAICAIRVTPLTLSDSRDLEQPLPRSARATPDETRICPCERSELERIARRCAHRDGRGGRGLGMTGGVRALGMTAEPDHFSMSERHDATRQLA